MVRSERAKSEKLEQQILSKHPTFLGQSYVSKPDRRGPAPRGPLLFIHHPDSSLLHASFHTQVDLRGSANKSCSQIGRGTSGGGNRERKAVCYGRGSAVQGAFNLADWPRRGRSRSARVADSEVLRSCVVSPMCRSVPVCPSAYLTGSKGQAPEGSFRLAPMPK